MLREPKEMETITKNYLTEIKNKNKYLIKTSSFINTKKLLEEAKKEHINKMDLLYLKELSKAQKENKMMTWIIRII